MELLRASLLLLVYPLFLTDVYGQASEAGALPKLSVKLTIVEGAPPSYYPLADEKDGGGAAIFDSFRRLPGPQPSVAQLIEQVSVSFRREGEGARFAVYVHVRDGALPDGGKVAEFTLAEGAEHSVTQLAGYGIEPIKVGLVRRAEVKLSPPRVENRTTGLEVAAVKVLEKELKFELVLRNVSQKSISAVEIDEYRGWERKGGPPHFDWKSRPPLKPGEEWKAVLEVGWNYKMTEEGHALQPADKVLIAAVVYTDGSHEGNTYFAARAAAFESGRVRQLSRVLDIMREWGEAFDPAAAVLDFGPRVEALDCTAEWAEVVALGERFHGPHGRQLDELKSSVEAGMAWQRRAALQELRGVAVEPATDPAGLALRLKEWRKYYERRLAGK